MKKTNKKDTKQSIIEAAGELFALRGIDGTGIRAIVQKAGTALSSVNYHFKNKEDLYEECINYVVREKINLNKIYTSLDNHSVSTPQDIANLLYKAIRDLFYLVLNPEFPNWYGVLLIRAKHEKHPVSERIMSEVSAPERIKEFILEHIPGIREEEAYLWVFSITGQLQNFVLAKKTVLETFGIKNYNAEFIDKLVNYSAKNLIRSLNLPKPDLPRHIL